MRKTGMRFGLHLLFWLLLLAIPAAMLALSSEFYLKSFATDDALYYPIIARNIVNGLGSTYDDGMTMTNGYHPLWAWLQVGVALLFGDYTSMVYLWWVKALTVATVVLSLIVWGGVIRRLFEDEAPAAIFLILLGGYWWSIYTLYSGMETPLVVLMMGLVLRQLQKLITETTYRLSSSLLLGLLMAGTLLARLDSIFFIGCVSLAVTILLFRRRWLWPFLTTFTVTILAVIPYLIWNLVNFGSLMPVSGLRKTPGLRLDTGMATLAHFWGNKVDKLLDLFGWPGVSLMLLVGAVVLILARQEFATALRKWGIAWTLVAGAILHYTYISFFMTEGDIHWYQYAEYLTVYLLLATGGYAVSLWLRASRWPQLSWAPVAGVGLFVLAILVFYAPGTLVNPVNVRTYDSAIWAREHTPRTARFGMYDSGVFHFVAERPTLSMNGLARDVRSMIETYQLDYIVTVVPQREAASLDAEYVRYLSDKVKVPHYYFDTAQYAILDTGYFRLSGGWQLSDAGLCRYQAILQARCPPERY